jgi:DNA-binding response OmpR family regulator
MGGEQLVKIVLGDAEPVRDENIEPFLEGLRQKLGPAGEWIEHVAGKGYGFCAPPGTRIEILRRRSGASPSHGLR